LPVARRTVLKAGAAFVSTWIGPPTLAQSADGESVGAPQSAEKTMTMAETPVGVTSKVTVERRGQIVLIGINRPSIHNRVDLCGATQHSNTNAHDKTSPAIPIGPHWMILWPFDANHCGLPTTVRDAGAWIMFAGTPYAYLHVCGTPWAGAEYLPGDEAVWTMRYRKKTAG
jgi:hypothetical protein